jgi:DNA polymerase-4
MAQGIDGSCVREGNIEKRIIQQADFDVDVIEETALRGAIEALAEHGGFEMRRDKLGATVINLVVMYADGIRAEGKEKLKRPCVLDRDIAAIAEKIFNSAAVRRVMIRSLGLSLEGLTHLGFEPDLFDPETVDRKLQEAVDKIQNRYGVGKISRGLVLAASQMQGGKRLLATGMLEYAH